jgi:hypothetical protein
VAVHKQKTNGKIMTAGQLRGLDDIEKLIQQRNDYQILKQLRSSSPRIGNLPKNLMAMI